MRTGDRVVVDFPGHPWHGKKCQVVADERLFDLAPLFGTPIPGRVIFIRRGMSEPIGFPIERVTQTAENARVRSEARDDDAGQQGELLL